jgi:transcriptional regulator GlxA family with amidase domain
MTRKIGIFLFDEVEVLDFTGPFEVFSTASRVFNRMHPDLSVPFNVFTIADRLRVIAARNDLLVQPNYSIAEHPRLDVLVVPGGVVTEEISRPEVIQWIKQSAHDASITVSVCTGAFLLAKAGLLENLLVTTHWEDIPDLRRMFPGLDVKENVRWVDNGNIITSAGISAGIDISLHLVQRLEGEELAVLTARQMEYDWQPK